MAGPRRTQHCIGMRRQQLAQWLRVLPQARCIVYTMLRLAKEYISTAAGSSHTIAAVAANTQTKRNKPHCSHTRTLIPHTRHLHVKGQRVAGGLDTSTARTCDRGD